LKETERRKLSKHQKGEEKLKKKGRKGQKTRKETRKEKPDSFRKTA